MSAEPWRAEPLPPETVAAVRAELGALVEGIVTAVGRLSPVYGDVLAAPEGMGIRLGIEQATRAFLDAVEQRRATRRPRPTSCGGDWARRSSRPAAASTICARRFAPGSRAAWRGAAELALRAGVSAPVAIALAEAIFVYGDELATDVVEGYLRMQSDEAGERERRRRRLATLLLDPAGHDPEALAARRRAGPLAGAAGAGRVGAGR